MLTAVEQAVLRFFRGTGMYVGKDARWKYRRPKLGTEFETLYSLRRNGFLDHFAANQWYLTDKGREFIYRGGEDGDKEASRKRL